MSNYIAKSNLSVNPEFYAFIEREALPGTGIDPARFWEALSGLVETLAPRNRELLDVRDQMQNQIDAWHRDHSGEPHDAAAYRDFLGEIGYLLPQPDPMPTVTTKNVDVEIATTPGPQLVVPVMNARFALNAANARWGSLYDALYGTDVIDEADGATRAGGYNPIRGAKVIAWARNFLDEVTPLVKGSHKDATAYRVADSELQVTLDGGEVTTLATPSQFAGMVGSADAPNAVLLRNNGLHI